MRNLLLAIVFLGSYGLGIAQNTSPQPICRSLASVIPYEVDSLVAVARYFDNGSYDVETPSELLRFSFSSNPNDSVRIFTCDNVETTVFLSVYVFDEIGANNFCTTFLVLLDTYCDSVSAQAPDTISPTIFVTDRRLNASPNPNNEYCFRPAQFVVAGYDNFETSNTEVLYSFSSDVNDTLHCFSCLDEGPHLIAIYATDMAGNQIHTFNFVVVEDPAGCNIDLLDTIQPVALCVSDTLLFLAQNGVFALFPEELDAGSYDDKTAQENLTFSFGESVEDSLILTCSDLGSHEFVLQVQDMVGNSSQCLASVIIADPGNICEPSSTSKPFSGRHGYFVAPNPGKGFKVSHNNERIIGEIREVVVRDVGGRVMHTWTKVIGDEFFQADFQPGLYTIQLVLKNGGHVYTKWIRQD